MWFTLFDLLGSSTVSPQVKESKRVSNSEFQSPGFLIFRIPLWLAYDDLTKGEGRMGATFA